MLKNKISILSTRPLHPSLIKEAAERNIIVEERSFIKTTLTSDGKIIEAIANYLQQPITVIFTSMNAVEAVIRYFKHPPQWKIYCIGNTTKNLVKEHFGSKSITGTALNASELGGVMIKDKITQAVFFCGDQRREELPGKLKQHNVITDEIIVYSTTETPALIDKKYDGILFFSPSAVESFFSINKIDSQTRLFAIGTTTAIAIQQYCKNNVVMPGSPGKEDMIKEVMKYYMER